MRERIYGLAAWVFVAATVVWALWQTYGAVGAAQPVPFNHRSHADFGIACDACHVGAKDAVRATTPNVQTCAFCHVPGKENPKTPQSLEEHIREMKPIPWQKIYKAPPHTRFSHKRHVEMAGLDCRVCHGDMGKMDKAVVRQAVPLQMAWCMGCHRKEKVTTDCMACHR